MRLQIEGITNEDWQYLHEIKDWADKEAFINCLQMVRNDGDIAAVISGSVGSGKSTYGIQLAKKMIYYLREYFKVINYDFDYKKNVVYGESKKLFDDMLGDSQFNVVVIDEGYLSGLNLESTKEITIFTGKVMNITRSKNNAILWCFQKMDRAAKFLSERFNLWYHKPRKRFVILFARTNIFTTKDPWGVKDLISATTERSIKFFIKHNTNRITYYATEKLPERELAIYKKYKIEAHQEIQRKEELKNKSKEVTVMVLKELYDRIGGGEMNIIDVPTYLIKKYNFNESDIKKYLKKYGEYAQMRKIMKANEIDTANIT